MSTDQRLETPIFGAVESAPETCRLCGAPHERTPSGWMCRKAIVGECEARLITAWKRNRKTPRIDDEEAAGAAAR